MARPADCGDFEILRRRTANFHPTCQISLQRWRNIKSDVAFALKHLALAEASAETISPRPYPLGSNSGMPLMTASSVGRSRLFHYCSALDIEPSEVDQTLEELLGALIYESFIGDPERLARRTAVLWRKCLRQSFPGWPATTSTQWSIGGTIIRFLWSGFLRPFRRTQKLSSCVG